MSRVFLVKLLKGSYNTTDGVIQDIARILYPEHTASGAIYDPYKSLTRQTY
jgi:hypothetical protein